MKLDVEKYSVKEEENSSAVPQIKQELEQETEEGGGGGGGGKQLRSGSCKTFIHCINIYSVTLQCCGSGSATDPYLKSPPGSGSAWTDAVPIPGGKKA